MYSKVSDTQNAHRLFEANKKNAVERIFILTAVTIVIPSLQELARTTVHR